MAYGRIYQSTFDSFAEEVYTIYIYKDGYAGEVFEIVCSQISVKQKLQEDNKYIPVRGGALEINFLNIDKKLPLVSFFSVKDNEFYVEYYWNTQLLFVGFIVQDDCEEVQVDFTHEINITVTDNIGLLKDVPYNNASALYGLRTNVTRQVETGANNQIRVTPVLSVQVGDLLLFDDTTPIPGLYEIISYYVLGAVTVMTINTMTTAIVLGTSMDFIHIRPPDLRNRLTYAELLRPIFLSTGLELATVVYANIIESTSAIARFLDETQISGETFLNGSSWDSCYTVLEKVMRRFNATFFQAYGVWNIRRNAELRPYQNNIPSWLYDSQMVFGGTSVLNSEMTYGNGSDIETGLTASIVRPFKFVEETFNYRQPENIFRNQNFDLLGNLITTYASGPNTVSEYEMTDWIDGFTWNVFGGVFIPSTTPRFIRVIRDPAGTELERYGVVIDDVTAPDGASVASAFPIDVNVGDRIRYSASFRTTDSNPGAGNINIDINLVTTPIPGVRGANNRYLANNGNWTVPRTLQFTWFAGDNLNVWHNFSFESTAIPFDGQLYIKLFNENSSPNVANETQFKDIQFEIIFAVTQTTGIIGQVHTDTQSPEINNSERTEIFVDDSPRNSIAGTQFLPNFPVLLQERTELWDYSFGGGQQKRLGQLITFEKLFERKKERTKLRGTLKGLVQSGHHFEPNAIIRYLNMNTLNFTVGLMTIDYKKDMVDVTLYEEYDDSEVFGAYVTIAQSVGSFVSTAPNTLVVSNTVAPSLLPNDTINLTGSAAAGIYTVVTAVPSGSDYIVTTLEPIISLSSGTLIIVQRRDTNAFLAQYYNFKYLYQKK